MAANAFRPANEGDAILASLFSVGMPSSASGGGSGGGAASSRPGGPTGGRNYQRELGRLRDLVASGETKELQESLEGIAGRGKGVRGARGGSARGRESGRGKGYVAPDGDVGGGSEIGRSRGSQCGRGRGGGRNRESGMEGVSSSTGIQSVGKDSRDRAGSSFGGEGRGGRGRGSGRGSRGRGGT
jgi:hypothetical protein